MEKEIEEMRRQQAQLDERMSNFQDLANEVLDIKAGNSHSLMKKWHYDVRFPNYLLDNLYGLEQTETAFKRWVGPESAIELRLPLDRSVQHIFEVTVVDFYHQAIEDNFKLSVDAEDVPWLWMNERSYQAIIPEDNRSGLRNHTQIALGSPGITQPAAMPEGDQRTLWFSISSMAVRVFD